MCPPIPLTTRIQSKKSLVALAITAPLLLASIVQGADGAWSAQGSSSDLYWDTAANWSGSIIADGAGFLGIFSALDLSTGRPIVLQSSRTIGSMWVGDSNSTARGPYTFKAENGSTLTFSDPSGLSYLTHLATSATNTFSLPVTLDNDLLITNHVGDATNVLKFEGPISAASAGVKRLIIGGGFATAHTTNPLAQSTVSGTTQIDGIVSDGAGKMQLVVDSPTGGVLILKGANTHSGGTILNQGILQFDNANAFGTGPLIINGGILRSTSAVTSTAKYEINGNFSYQGTVTSMIGSNATNSLNTNATVSVNYSLGGSVNQLNLHGNINDNAAAYSLTKTGNGTLYTNGANSTYSGGTFLLGGRLVVSYLNSLGTGSVTLKNGANLSLNGSGLNQTFINRIQTDARGSVGTWNQVVSNNIDLSSYEHLYFGVGSGTMTYSGVLTPYGNTYKFGSIGGTTQINSALTGADRSVTIGVEGSYYGNLVLAGANTYEGTTTAYGKSNLQLYAATGSMSTASDIHFNGGSFTFNNIDATGEVHREVGAFYADHGDSTLTQARNANFNSSITFQGFERSAGATLNLTYSGTGVAADLNQIKFLNTSSTGNAFIDQGLFVSSTNYGVIDSTGGHVRAMVYNSDVDAVNLAAAGSLTSVGAKHVNLQGTLSNQASAAIKTLRIGAGYQVSLNSDATLTLTEGGILKAGTGAVTISGGTITAGSKELVIRVENDSLTISSNIDSSSTGGLTKSGANTLILSGTNTYVGNTTVNAGTLRIMGQQALAAGDVHLFGGTFEVRTDGLLGPGSGGTFEKIWFGNSIFVDHDATLAVQTIFGTTTFQNKTIQFNNLAIGNSTLTISNNNGYGVEFVGTTTLVENVFEKSTIHTGNARPSKLVPSIHLSGKVTGKSNLTLIGNGVLYLTNASNDFVGDITVSSGTLAFNSDEALGASSNQVILADSLTTSTLRATETFATNRNILFNNNLASRNIIQVNSGKTFTISSSITGQNGFVKAENGILELAGDNRNWDGDLLIHDGVIKVTSATGLGSIKGATFVGNMEAALHLHGDFVMEEELTLFGSGVNSTGALYQASGNSSWNGKVNLDGDATIGVAASSSLTFAGQGVQFTRNLGTTNNPNTADLFELTFNGEGNGFVHSEINIDNSYFYKNGTGTWTFTKKITTTRDVSVLNGTMTLAGSEGAVSSSANLRIGPAGTLLLDNSEAASNDRLGKRGVYLGGNLTIIGASNATTIEGPTGGNLVFGNTHGTLTLDAIGTGQVQFAITSGSILRNARGTGLFRGDLLGTASAQGGTKITATTTPTFIGENGGSNTKNAGILSWALVDTSTSGLGQGFATYDGTHGIRLLNAMEQVNYLDASSNIRTFETKNILATSTINSLTLESGGGVINQIHHALKVSSGGILAFDGNTGIHGGTLETLSNRDFIVHALGDIHISSVLMNSTGGLSKAGAGTLTLSGANFYTGATTVNQGTLQLASGDHRLGVAQDLYVNYSGVFDLNGFNQSVAGLRSSGSSGSEAALNGGRVINSSAQTATLALNYTGTTAQTSYAGTIEGDLNLVRSNTSVVSFYNELSHTGKSLFNGGTTILRNDGAVSNSVHIRISNANLMLGNHDASANSNRLNDNATIELNSGGLNLLGRAGSDVLEQVGQVHVLAGLNVISASAGSNQTHLSNASSTLRIAELTRNAETASVISFAQTYAQTSTERLGLVSSANGSSQNIIIEGGIPLTNNIIGPWALYNSYQIHEALEFASYDQQGGVGALNAAGFAGYDASTISSNVQAHHNVRVSMTANLTLDNTTLNVLNLVAASTLTTPVVSFNTDTTLLNLAGGALAISQAYSSSTSNPAPVWTIGSAVNQGRITAGGTSPSGRTDLYLYYQNTASANELVLNAAIIDNPNNGGQAIRAVFNGTHFGNFIYSLRSTQNNYTGGTVINQAHVKVNGNFGTGGISLYGGTLTINAGATISAQDYSLNGPSNVSVNIAALTVNQLSFHNTGGSLVTNSTSSSTLGSMNFTLASGTTLTLTGDLTASSSNVAFTPTITGGTLSLGSGTKRFTINPIEYETLLSPTQSTLSITSVITGTGLNLVKDGAGMLQLGGANTFTGTLNVTAGGIIAAHNNALGSSAVILGHNTRLSADGTGRTLNNAVTLSGDLFLGTRTPLSSTALNLTGAMTWGSTVRTITVESLATNLQTFSGTITGSGGIVKKGIGTLVIAGANGTSLDWTSSKAIQVLEGTLRTTSDVRLGKAPTTVVTDNIVLNGGTLGVYSAAQTIHSNRGIVLGGENGSGTGVIDVDASATSATYNGVIADHGPNGVGTLQKNGTGTLILGGVSTYKGDTFLSGGTIRMSAAGKLAGTRKIALGHGTTFDVSAYSNGYDLESNQRLEGAGQVLGRLNVKAGAILAPGIASNKATDSLTFGDLHLLSGSTTLLQLSGATFTSNNDFGNQDYGSLGYQQYVLANGTGQGNHDQLKITGNFRQETGAKIEVSFLDFTPELGQIFNLIDWGNLLEISSANGTEQIFRNGSNDQLLDLDLPNLAAYNLDWELSLFASHGIIVIVPEPTKGVLLILSGAALLLRRRRLLAA